MKIKITIKQKSTPITSSPLIVSIMQDILKRDSEYGREQEHFWLIGLDYYNKIQFIELLALGGRNQVHLDSTDVFRMAVLKGTLRVILMHNHPDGDVEPSDEDKKATECLSKIGEMIKIEVIDHIIITETDYFSFADEGILDELKTSDAYRLLDKEKFSALKSKFIEEGKKQEKLALVKILQANKIKHDIILEITGLGPEDVTIA